MEKRRKPRQTRRLSCEIWTEGKRHTGIVRDVSELGLYVQTRLRAGAGTELELVFAAERERPALRVQVRVVRQNRLTAHFATSGAGGLGLEVTEPAQGLAPLLEGAGFGNAPVPAQADPAPSLRPFRVKLSALRGPQTQTVAVRAPSLQAARSRALARAGSGWKVSEVLEG